MLTLPESWGAKPVDDNDPVSWGATPVSDAPTGSAPGLSEEFVSKVKGWEGFAPKASWDYKQHSIGYGTRARSAGETISQEDADKRLREELTMHAGNVDKAAQEFGYQLTPRQREALISFDFNTGSARSVMQVSEGNLDNLATRISHYIHADGKEHEGLKNRRRDELEWFRGSGTSEQDGPLAWGAKPVNDNDPASWGATPLEESNHDIRNSFVQGALDQGFYSGVEGAVRGVSNVIKQLPSNVAEVGLRAVSAMNPAGLMMQGTEMMGGAPQTSYRDTATSLLDAYAGGVADVRGNVKESLPVTPEFAQSLGGQIISGFGQAVGTLPTYVIPGFGPASSVGMIYDQGYQDALQAGVSPAEAHKAALMNLPSSALDIVGDKLVIGRILKPLKGKMTVGQLVKSVGASALSGGLTEAGQQLWQNTVAKYLAGYAPDRPLDDQVINSLIVGAIVDSGVTGAGGAASMAAGRGSVDGTNTTNRTNAINTAPGLGEIRVDQELPADVEALFAPSEEAAAVEPATVPAAEPESAPATEETTPLSPAADRARVVDENLRAMEELRAIKQQQQSQTAPAPEQTTAPHTEPIQVSSWEEVGQQAPPQSAEARAAEQAHREEMENELRQVEDEQTVGLDEALRRAGGLPGRRSPHWREWAGELGQLWEARQGARQSQGSTRAFQNLFRDDAASLDTVTESLREQGFQVDTADDVFALVDEWLRTGREPRVMQSFEAAVAPENIPFSQQLGIATTLPPEQAAPLAHAIRQTYDEAGIHSVPPVRLVQTVDEIPEHLGGRDARNAVAQGSIVEAFFDPRKGQRGITIVINGAAQIATQRGISLEQRVRELGLHEIVHHFQTVGALLPANARREYNQIVEGVLGHMPEKERKQLAELYGFDLNTPRGRAALAEEYLARFHEAQTAPPSWVQQVWARIRTLLRRVFPHLQWSDAELRALLDAARRKAESIAVAATGSPVALSQQHPDNMWDRISSVFLTLAQSDEAFQFPREITGKTPEEVAHQISTPGRPIRAQWINGKRFRLQSQNGSIEVFKIDDRHWEIKALRAGSRGREGGGGAQLYQAAFAWAHNNGITIRPAYALTTVNQLRRTSNMLSSALRFGTTEHLRPHKSQGVAWAEGDHYGNISALAFAEADRVMHLVPELRNLTIDPQTLTVRDHDGREVSDGELSGYINRADPEHDKGVGLATAKRSILVRSAGLLPESRQLAPELGATLLQSAARGGLSRIFYSQQAPPTQAEAEAAAKDPQKRRRFIDSAKNSPFLKSDIKDRIESLYTPITNAATVAEAANQINTLGVDRALAQVLATNATNPPTALTNAIGIDLLGRLQALERYEDAGQLVEHIAQQATTQGQAIQALSLLARLSPEGVQTYAQKQVTMAAKDNPAMQKLLDEIRSLRDQLQKAKKTQGTKAVLGIQDLLKAMKLDPKGLATINGKLRDILTTSIGQSGYARDRIVGVLVAAGMDRQKAIQLAERAVKAFEREAQRARDQVLKQLLKQQVRDAIHGPQITAADRMNERLEKLFYANPGSVWGRYKKQAVDALASKLSPTNMSRPEIPALQEFTTRLTKQLQAMIPPEALANRPDLEPNPTPEAAYIGEAIRNFDKYQEVWTTAQDFIRDKYRNDDFTLTQLDGYLGQILARPFSPTSLTKAVDQTMRSLNVRIGDLLLRSKDVQGKTAALVVKIITEQAGVSSKQATELAQDIMQELGKQGQAARESFAKRLLTPKEKRSGATKGELQRWVEMNNAGLLDDNALLEQIAQKRGLPVLTRDMARKIQQLQQEYDNAPDGVVKLVKGADMLDHIHSMIPSDGWSKARAAQNISMLLNPKTAIRNVLGNAAMWVGNTFADGVSAAVDPLVGVVTGKRTHPSFYLAARLRGLMAPIDDFKAGRDHALAQGAERRPAIAAGIRTAVEMARLTSSGKYDVSAVGQSHRHVFSSRVGRLFEDMLTASLGLFDRAFHQSAYLASLEREMRTRGEVAPSEESITAAHMDAQKATYQDDNFVSKYLGQAVKAVNRLSTAGATDRYGLGTIVMPFTQVPGSLLLRGAEWSPVGFIRTGLEVFRPVFGREFRQKEFVDAFTRAALGSGAMALGFWLYKLGVLSGAPEDDEDREAMRRASGLGSYRINASELKRRMMSGNWHSPASQLEAAQEGDTIVNYDWLQPSAVPLAMGAQMAQNEDQAKREMQKGKAAELPSVALTMVLAGSKTLEDQPLLTGLFKFMGDLSSAHRQNASLLEPIGRSILSVPGNFIPGSLVSQVGQLLDNTPRETRGGDVFAQELNRTLARIPGVAGRFPARYDIFGEAQERYQYGRNTLFNVLINPAFVSEVKKNPVTAELERLYAATGDGAAIPRQVDRKITINGKQLELTNEQLSAYQRYTGKLSMSIFGQLVAAPGYARLPDSEKARIFAGILGDVNTAAKQELFGQKPVTIGKGGQLNINRHAILFRALGRVRGIPTEP